MEGRCSREEILQFEQWWKEHPDEVDNFFERVWLEKPGAEQYDRERAGLWEELQGQIYSVQGLGYPDNDLIGNPNRIRRKIAWIGYAAAAILVAAVLYNVLPRLQNEKQGIAGTWTKVENNTARPRNFHLPDGTNVWLNGHSILEYAEGFNAADRKTRLKGEAFFEVSKDPERPFTVETAGFITKVLGTSFNIDAYPGEQSEHVALVQGSIGVRPGGVTPDSALLLAPGEMATFSNRSHLLVKDHFMVNDVRAWINGKLVLDQVELSDVLQRIALQTGVAVTMDKRLSSRSLKISGVYDLGSIDKILQSIAFVHRLKVIGQKGHYSLME